MTLELIGDLWEKKKNLERDGKGYSQYTDLSAEEVDALTRVDAIGIGMSVRNEHGELMPEEESQLIAELAVIKNSEAWFSAAGKLATSGRVRQIVKERINEL